MKVDINNLMKLAEAIVSAHEANDGKALLFARHELTYAITPEVIKALCEVVLKAQAYLDAYDNGVSFIDALSSFGETQDALRQALSPFQESGQ